MNVWMVRTLPAVIASTDLSIDLDQGCSSRMVMFRLPPRRSMLELRVATTSGLRSYSFLVLYPSSACW